MQVQSGAAGGRASSRDAKAGLGVERGSRDRVRRYQTPAVEAKTTEAGEACSRRRPTALVLGRGLPRRPPAAGTLPHLGIDAVAHRFESGYAVRAKQVSYETDSRAPPGRRSRAPGGRYVQVVHEQHDRMLERTVEELADVGHEAGPRQGEPGYR